MKYFLTSPILVSSQNAVPLRLLLSHLIISEKNCTHFISQDNATQSPVQTIAQCLLTSRASILLI